MNQQLNAVTIAGLSSPNEVDENSGRFKAAGAHIIKAAENIFWDGYSGFVADPEDVFGRFATIRDQAGRPETNPCFLFRGLL
jgi:hypothetical protein